MGMALYKAAEFWRISNGLTGMKLIKILILDQFSYFMLYVLNSIFPLFQFLVTPIRSTYSLTKFLFFVHIYSAFACFVVNIVLNQVSVPNLFLWAAIGTLGSPSFMCLLGCKLLIHLKEAGESGVNAGTSYRLKTISNVSEIAYA